MIYLIEVSILWMASMIIYWAMYRKTTFFQWNRWFLLGSLAVGLTAPFLAQHIPTFTSPSPVRTFIYDVSAIELDIVATPEQDGYSISPLWSIYILGVLIAGSRMLYGLYQIARLYTNARREEWYGYTLVITDQHILPFSFMKSVYIGTQEEVSEMKDIILRHERIHMDQGHTWDTLFVALLRVFFWVNPILLLYYRELKNIHEYIADNEVANTYSKASYSQLLLEKMLSGKQVNLTNQFYSSNIKKRITMMYKKHTSNQKKWLYALALPVILLTTMSFAKAKKEYVHLTELGDTQYTVSRDTVVPKNLTPNHWANISNWLRSDTIIPPAPPAPPKVSSVPPPPPPLPAPPRGVDSESVIYNRVDEMPLFAGCDHLVKKIERQTCSQENVLRFIYENLKYPEDARAEKAEGMAIIRFVIDTDGSTKNKEILRAPHPSFGAEVSRIVDMFPTWTPGKNRGVAVPVRYTLPVRFQLGNDKAEKKE